MDTPPQGSEEDTLTQWLVLVREETAESRGSGDSGRQESVCHCWDESSHRGFYVFLTIDFLKQ